MSVAKFTKVESLFRTTLAAGITSTQTTIEFNDAPGSLTEFPQWFVIEPLSSNYEIIYVPADSGTATQINVVRGINPNEDTDVLSAAFCKAHAANVDVILAPMHRHWNELVDVMDGTDGTGSAIFRIGLDTDVNITIYANNADASKPYVQYNAASNKWLISNDGTSTYDIAAGGSGVIRGPGIDIIGSALTLDVRSSGGLRNNQGTGSAQCDVDPTVVARLDTANTWTAVQSLTADRAQITTDPDSANDACRKSYVDAQTVGAYFGDGSDGAFAQSSGTTTLNDATKNVYQYSSFDLTGTAIFTTGANLNNKPLIIFVQGNLTITSSGSPAVDRKGKGGTAGITVGAGAEGGSVYISNGGSPGTNGAISAGGGGGGGLGNAGTAGTNGTGAGGAGGAKMPYSTLRPIAQMVELAFIGGGGGGGSNDTGGSGSGEIGAVGGAGGGCIIFIVGGDINISSVFSCAGDAGGNGPGGYGGGGGGGGGGFIGIYYRGSVVANTATLTVAGGAGGTVATEGGAGGAGGAGQSEVRQIKVPAALI